MQRHPKPIATRQELDAICARARQAPMLAIDTEFIREHTFYPKIALVQLATRDEAWLVDAAALRREEVAPLLALLRSPDILKILHAAQADQECLSCSWGVTATPTFDTMEAASLTGHGTSVGLATLAEKLLQVRLHKGHARTNWLARPLPEQLATYALEDVVHLIPLAEKLLAELDRLKRRDLAMAHSAKWEDQRRYEPDPAGLAEKLARSGKLDRRAYAAVQRLMEWRERRVRELDIPRRRLAEDAILVDLARTRPKTLMQLQSFRGLHGGEIKRSAEHLLALFRDVEALRDDQLPALPQRTRRPHKDARVADLIGCAVRLLAEQHHIAPGHILSADEIARLSGELPSDPDAAVAQGMLSAEARRLIGDDLWRLLRGEAGLCIRDGSVQWVSVPAAPEKRS